MTLGPKMPAELGEASLEVASGDALEVRQISVHERMSTLFVVSLVVVCDNANVDFEAVVGQKARFTLRAGRQEKSWSGVCNHLQLIAVEESGLSTYQINIVPTLWLTTQRRNYRIFQQQSELGIALAVLDEWGIEPLKKITGKYKKRKYRVQYAESDYAFLCRMLEDAGIAFYFVQQGADTKLVLADAPQTNEPRASKIAFRDQPTLNDEEHVTAVRVARQVKPGRYTMRDHDYRLPAEYPLVADAASGAAMEQRLESYHYTPGAFLFGTDKGEDTTHADDRGKTRTDEGEGKSLAAKRLAAKRGNAVVIQFVTSALDLAPGVVMSMLDHPRAELGENERLLVVESTLSGDLRHLAASCEARSASQPYRPPLLTPKPKIVGVESATVVGPKGEEIHTDEFGRVRVHFHWDRESKRDDKSSCWIHVSQSWGGSGFGGSNLPRIGQEVIVDFLGGDPDRPIITGRVYTNLQKTPYKLPDNKTQSGWKSNSTGNTGGYNEIMFEDVGGSELFRVQAEKDRQTLVKNDDQQTVGRDRTRMVKRNETVTVGKDRTKRVVKNEAQQIGQNQSITVGVNRSTQVGVIDSTVVGDTHVVQIAPPGEGGGAGSSSVVMKDKQITLDTGAGATITMSGDTITIEANTIFLFAKTFLGAASMGEAVVGGATHLTVGSANAALLNGVSGVNITSSGGDVNIKGGPLVKINT